MKTLIWLVPFCAGGLCDRLLGLIATHCIAEELNRKVLIKWDKTDISSVLSIKNEYNYYTYNYSYIEKLKMNLEYMEFFNTNIEEEWKDIDHILLWSNLNTFYYFCQTRPNIDYESKFLYACSNILKIYFDTIPEIDNNILDLNNTIGIHIRTHDNQIKEDAEENRTKQIPYISDIFLKCKKFLDYQSIKRIFISSDCSLSSQLAKIIFGPEYTIISNNGPIIHSGFDTCKDGLIRVLSDLISLSKCTSLIIGWNSNFSRIGALMNSNRKFYIYEKNSTLNSIEQVSLLELMNYHSQPNRRTEEYV